MDFNSLIRLFFILLSGITSFLIYEKLADRSTNKDWRDFLSISIFSFFNYLILEIIKLLLNFLPYIDVAYSPSLVPKMFSIIFNNKAEIPWHDVYLSAVVGIFIGGLTAWAYNQNLLNRFAIFLKLTKKFGDGDVWTYFLNQKQFIENWVFVRDFKNDLLYFGWIDHFSDKDNYRELLIKDVKIYNNSSGEYLYDSQVCYICLEHNYFSIEIPKENKNDGQK